jgi:FAD/FMN-containing dehydrogenase
MSRLPRFRFERVNDVHSALNPARVQVHRPRLAEQVRTAIRAAREAGSPVAICGGRHAMGGQQFADGGHLLDMRRMNRVLSLDIDRGLVRAEAGIQWPDLVRGILEAQRRADPGRPPRWGIAQKPTGADSITIGGALSANVHGRGLLMGPIVGDVESFTLIDAAGDTIECSRSRNAELFSLAIGGYGLFGVITEVTLRLAPRRTLRRVVRVIDIEDAVHAAQRRIDEGFLYGDFQFDVDPDSPDFLTRGVFCGYSPVEGNPEPPAGQRWLRRDEWLDLLTLAHTDKTQAFARYAQHYLATDGQLYHSDTHQLSEYLDGYHTEVDRRTGAAQPGSEIITELFVPPERLVEFLRAAAGLLIARGSPVIYGTIRLVQPDVETVLAWARQRFACVIFNLHVDHAAGPIERWQDPAGLGSSPWVGDPSRQAVSFRALIDLAADLGGSYYLTYHRFATPEQLERCFPRVRQCFSAKHRYDPSGVFQSDWFRHYAPTFIAGGAA